MTPTELAEHLSSNRARGAVALLQLLDHVDALEHLARGSSQPDVLADDLANLAAMMRDTTTNLRHAILDPELDTLADGY